MHIGYFEDELKAAQAVDKVFKERTGKTPNKNLMEELAKVAKKQSENDDDAEMKTTKYDGVFWDSKLKGWRIKATKHSDQIKLYKTDEYAALACNELFKSKGRPLLNPVLEKEPDDLDVTQKIL